MSARRVAAAALVIGVVAVLFSWQRYREEQIARCHAANGVWNGPSSSCSTLGGRPLLRREGLGRS